MTERPCIIRARIEPELKEQFDRAARANDRAASQVLRDLVREYIYRHSIGEAWEPGSAVKQQPRRKGHYDEK
jgi:hypothetical protein